MDCAFARRVLRLDTLLLLKGHINHPPLSQAGLRAGSSDGDHGEQQQQDNYREWWRRCPCPCAWLTVGNHEWLVFEHDCQLTVWDVPNRERKEGQEVQRQKDRRTNNSRPFALEQQEIHRVNIIIRSFLLLQHRVLISNYSTCRGGAEEKRKKKKNRIGC